MPTSLPSWPGSSVPEACAGLRQALLHGATAGFPLAEAPFQELSRRHGGSVRELLAHCQALHREGAVQGLAVHWAPALQRVHWRCGLAAGDAGWPALARATPGLTVWDRLAPLAGCTLWFELGARDEVSARAQLAAIEARQGPVLCMAAEAPPMPACTCNGGPCADPQLAGRCEAGLPLVAQPWRALARGLQRPQRAVIAALRRWQQAGQLAGVGLQATEPEHEEAWQAVVVPGPPLAPDQVALLRAAPGVAELWAAPPGARWPFAAWLATRAAAAGPLERALQRAGVPPGRVQRRTLQRTRVRAEPRLFAG